jgi:hypothetical protein
LSELVQKQLAQRVPLYYLLASDVSDQVLLMLLYLVAVIAVPLVVSRRHG